ncbi:MAG: hypothetical protein PVJ57_16320 [Phycisphaerae bacterium]
MAQRFRFGDLQEPAGSAVDTDHVAVVVERDDALVEAVKDRLELSTVQYVVPRPGHSIRTRFSG